MADDPRRCRVHWKCEWRRCLAELTAGTRRDHAVSRMDLIRVVGAKNLAAVVGCEVSQQQLGAGQRNMDVPLKVMSMPCWAC